MQAEKKVLFEKAQVQDADDIINLYRLVYGKKYPISYGTDSDLLKKAILDLDTHLVLVSRDSFKKNIVGALITELDKYNKIGKLVGLVVHPEFQRMKIGNGMVEYVGIYFLEKGNEINSLYATTRTNTPGAQRVFIKNNYLPLGIFPNAHRLSQYETVALFAKFKKNILEQRKASAEVSEALEALYQILKKNSPHLLLPLFRKLPPMTNNLKEEAWEFEIIRAPDYVYKKFLETFPNPRDRFFPFHKPNMLIAEKKGRIEIFSYFSKRDGYCTLIKATKPISEVRASLQSLYMQLDDLGVSYIEVLLNVKLTSMIEYLVAGQFIPSAIYPAMREVDGDFEDYIVLSRTMESLDFKGMSIISQFIPFINQYVDTWKKINLESIEVLYGEK